MKSFVFVFFLFIVMFSFSNCLYNKEDKLYPDNPCDTTHITYNGKIDSVFAANTCYTCHATSVAPPDGGGLRLDIYPVVKENINRVYGAITHKNGFKPMPLGQSETIDPCAIKIIQIWKDSGMPEK